MKNVVHLGSPWKMVQLGRWCSRAVWPFTSRFVTHLPFLVVAIATALLATSPFVRIVMTPPSTPHPAAAGKVVAALASQSRQVSLVRYHNDDSVIYRGFVQVADSSVGVVPTGELEAFRAVLQYTVQPGDTLFGIAAAFGLSPETVLWSNYKVLKDNPEMLSVGLELFIPPANGLLTEVQVGDTLDAIAQRFKVTPEVILTEPLNGFNSAAPDLPTGKTLFVPGGQRELVIWEVPEPVEVQRVTASGVRVYSVGNCGEVAIPALGSGTFVYPTGRSALSGYDFSGTHPGLDFAAQAGDAIYAADSGTVIFAGDSLNAAGQYVGYGKYIVLDHGNGYQTLYSHNSQNYVTCGQQVLQGSVIGVVGSTGNSSGPHLHFEIRNNRLAVDPWTLLPPP